VTEPEQNFHLDKYAGYIIDEMSANTQAPIDWNALLEIDLEEVERLLTEDEVDRMLYEAEHMNEVELLLEDAERLLEEFEKLTAHRVSPRP